MATGLYCLEVGHGNCLLMLEGSPGDGRATLVDVGANGRGLAHWLRSLGVTHLPLIAATHNDRDHMRGLAQLVEHYRGRIGQLWFLRDREADPPFWQGALHWHEEGWIESIARLEAPAQANAGDGAALMPAREGSYEIYCIYPRMFDVAAVADNATALEPAPGRGANAASAVLRLARRLAPMETLVLFGGDLDFRGWRRLYASDDLHAEVFVVPHHGAPAFPAVDFHDEHLAGAVHPRLALISVGTRQDYGHPHAEMIAALRGNGATVVCTQITLRCLSGPIHAARDAILARRSDSPDLHRSGSACAGTVVVRIPDRGPLEVSRLADHQAAVEGLLEGGHTPLCRP